MSQIESAERASVWLAMTLTLYRRLDEGRLDVLCRLDAAHGTRHRHEILYKWVMLKRSQSACIHEERDLLGAKNILSCARWVEREAGRGNRRFSQEQQRQHLVHSSTTLIEAVGPWNAFFSSHHSLMRTRACVYIEVLMLLWGPTADSSLAGTVRKPHPTNRAPF